MLTEVFVNYCRCRLHSDTTRRLKAQRSRLDRQSQRQILKLSDLELDFVTFPDGCVERLGLFCFLISILIPFQKERRNKGKILNY